MTKSQQDPSFTITQDMDIALPQKARAFPITTQEWLLLRQSVNSIGDSNSFYHTMGSALVGAGISTGIAASLMNIATNEQTQQISMWAIAAVCIVCGGFALFFGYKEKRVIQKSSAQVLAQMDLVEDRYGIEGFTSRGTPVH